ncbi:hypothetical protein MRB53_040453 [Persea americana]|nr:hypothetical protein MRB53_040453 [Persea americana]
MFVRQSVFALSRRAAARPVAARALSAAITRRDAKQATPSQSVTGKKIDLKLEDIRSEADLMPEGAAPGTVPTDLEQATGLERLEILGKMQGVDIFDMKPLPSDRLGTLQDPIMVKSFGDEQYCGCTGVPADSHHVLWLTVRSSYRVMNATSCLPEYTGHAKRRLGVSASSPLLTFRASGRPSTTLTNHGALAIPGGRDIVPRINGLLCQPFKLKIATQDWHPQDHVSFASNHSSNHEPFVSTARVVNPLNDKESEEIPLWPDHCVQHTPGAKLLPELEQGRFDHIVKKGQDKRVEMYSAFKDTFVAPCVSKSDLSAILHNAAIRRVFVVGLALDYCVKHTALHAAEEGFVTTVIKEATRASDSSATVMERLATDFKKASVNFDTTLA